MTRGFSQQKAGLEKRSGLVGCTGLAACSVLLQHTALSGLGASCSHEMAGRTRTSLVPQPLIFPADRAGVPCVVRSNTPRSDGFHQGGRCGFGPGSALHPVKGLQTEALSLESDQTTFKVLCSSATRY